MTTNEFIQHEIAIWGEDYVFDLFDKGYTVVTVANGVDTLHKWVLPSRTLRSGRDRATLALALGERR